MKTPKILLYNKQEIFQCVLMNITPNGFPFFADQGELSTDYGALDYQFSVPADHQFSDRLEEEGLIAIEDHFSDQGDGYLLYKIRKVTTDIRNGQSILNVHCRSDSVGLSKIPVRPITMIGYTLTQALTQLLIGTPWEPGYIEFLGAHDFVIENHMYTMEAVHQLRSVYDCEIRFRGKLKGTKIVRRYIDIAETFGRKTGHRFEVGKDIQSIIKDVDTTDLYTAVLGVGTDDKGNPISFKDIVWSKAAGNALDKPAGQDWLGDPDALEKWGDVDKQGNRIHKTFIYESDKKAPGPLLGDSYHKLKTLRTPKIEMEIEAVRLEDISGYEHDKKRLGDTLIARITALNPIFTASIRLTKMTFSQTEPSREKLTLSNYTELSSTLSKSIVERMDDLIRERQAIWEAAEANAKAYADAQDESLYADSTYYADQVSAPGTAAKEKLDTEVGAAVIETTTGSGEKATAAEEAAKTYSEDATNLKRGVLNPSLVKIEDGNKSVTIDANGVNAKNGSFTLQDDRTAQKYSLLKKTNLISDHSFELLTYADTALIDGTYNDWPVQPSTDSYMNWATVGTPRLTTMKNSGNPNLRGIFGLQGVKVNSTNFLKQSIDFTPGKTYTLSFHARASNRSASAVPVARYWVEDALGVTVIQQSKSFTSVTDKVNPYRFAFTFTVPATKNEDDIMLIEIKTSNVNWMDLDGVQLIESDTPSYYDDEQTVFDFLNGLIRGGLLQIGGLDIHGPGTGAANVTVLAIYDAEGTRIGYFGDASTGNGRFIVRSDIDDLQLSSLTNKVLFPGNVAIKSNGAIAMFRNHTDDSFIEVQANKFTTISSRRETKTNIERPAFKALDYFDNGLGAYLYDVKTEKYILDENGEIVATKLSPILNADGKIIGYDPPPMLKKKHLGLMLDELPDDVSDDSGGGVNHYAHGTFNTMAIGELYEKVKQENTELKNRLKVIEDQLGISTA